MRIRAYIVSKISGKPINECASWLGIRRPKVYSPLRKKKHELCRGRGDCWACQDEVGPHCLCTDYWWLEKAVCDSQAGEDFDRTHERCSNGCGLCLSNIGYWHCVCGNLWDDLAKKCYSQMTKEKAASACSDDNARPIDPENEIA